MKFPIKKSDKYTYVEQGSGEPLVLLHGLFGTTGNFTALVNGFCKQYRVLVPILPIFETPVRALNMLTLRDYLLDFFEHFHLDKIHLVGNSLGGHLGLLVTLQNPAIVQSLTLTGSSGLFENALGSGFPRRQDYDFVADVCRNVFHDPKVATKELVDEVFETVNNSSKGLNIVVTAKSAMRHNLENELDKIHVPTLLIWGREDKITPLFVGEEFKNKIKHSELHIFDACGHAPMMEKPQAFIEILKAFLLRNVISDHQTS